MALLDDAVQEAFLDCFKTAGALQRIDTSSPQGFRAFLHGVARNVALHFETRAAREAQKREPGSFHPELTAHEEAGLSTVFDRAYAMAILREAGALHEARARLEGGATWRRFELLRLRFFEAMPVREIARLWGDDNQHVHNEHARARREFRAALGEVVAGHERKTVEQVDEECRRLLAIFA